jgi:hypothetical protein
VTRLLLPFFIYPNEQLDAGGAASFNARMFASGEDFLSTFDSYRHVRSAPPLLSARSSSSGTAQTADVIGRQLLDKAHDSRSSSGSSSDRMACGSVSVQHASSATTISSSSSSGSSSSAAHDDVSVQVASGSGSNSAAGDDLSEQRQGSDSSSGGSSAHSTTASSERHDYSHSDGICHADNCISSDSCGVHGAVSAEDDDDQLDWEWGVGEAELQAQNVLEEQEQDSSSSSSSSSSKATGVTSIVRKELLALMRDYAGELIHCELLEDPDTAARNSAAHSNVICKCADEARHTMVWKLKGKRCCRCCCTPCEDLVRGACACRVTCGDDLAKQLLCPGTVNCNSCPCNSGVFASVRRSSSSSGSSNSKSTSLNSNTGSISNAKKSANSNSSSSSSSSSSSGAKKSGNRSSSSSSSSDGTKKAGSSSNDIADTGNSSNSSSSGEDSSSAAATSGSAANTPAGPTGYSGQLIAAARAAGDDAEVQRLLQYGAEVTRRSRVRISTVSPAIYHTGIDLKQCTC